MLRSLEAMMLGGLEAIMLGGKGKEHSTRSIGIKWTI
jgi:hypothetical protein